MFYLKVYYYNKFILTSFLPRDVSQVYNKDGNCYASGEPGILLSQIQNLEWSRFLHVSIIPWPSPTISYQQWLKKPEKKIPSIERKPFKRNRKTRKMNREKKRNRKRNQNGSLQRKQSWERIQNSHYKSRIQYG